jgi:HlyD family secretion protein
MSTPKIVKRAAVITMVAIGVAGAVFVSSQHRELTHYVTQEVTRGPIIRFVSATGTVNPVITVQVGTYVSGPIQAIYTDFNAKVKGGQLCAKIDPRPYQILVDQARAALANSEAQLTKDRADLSYREVFYHRAGLLLRANVLATNAYDNARSAADQARAQVALDAAAIEERKAALRQAETNLGYTNIVSPVDGTVVARNVDVGQTVAASFQTPTLFLIAKDLTEMQVDTNISESDIGAIRGGQQTEFMVDAFPDRKFEGVVAQVRQAPITVQNVVTYDVVVSVANPEFLLKPGMTANVSIVVDHRDSVLRLPVAALGFVPPQYTSSGPEVASGPEAGQRKAQVWMPTPTGGLRPIEVKLGMNNDTFVEMLEGDLQPGDVVATSLAGPGSKMPPQAVLAFNH